MEQVESMNLLKQATWIDKRCRALVHAVFEKISYGQIEVIEGAQHSFYPEHYQENEPQGRIFIHDVSIYRDFVKGGSIGVAEAFIEGKWSSSNLTNVIRIFAKAQQETDTLEQNKSWMNKVKNAVTHWQNRNTQSGSKRNILAHYDLGNELYTRFLDPSMMYSSAVYPSENASLDEAQQHKLKLICEKLNLKESDHLLEIGTGWGGLAISSSQVFSWIEYRVQAHRI